MKYQTASPEAFQADVRNGPETVQHNTIVLKFVFPGLWCNLGQLAFGLPSVGRFSSGRGSLWLVFEREVEEGEAPRKL